MTIIKRYSENRELLIEDKPVDTDNVEQYLSQYAPEYAQGYLQALNDIENGLEGILWKKIESNYAIPNGTARIHTALKAFYNHKLKLMEKFKVLGVKLPPVTHSPNPMQD